MEGTKGSEQGGGVHLKFGNRIKNCRFFHLCVLFTVDGLSDVSCTTHRSVPSSEGGGRPGSDSSNLRKCFRSIIYKI